jgi:SpoVK/Ycf46/Vps4 family AAA+-type ATPase
MANIRDLASLFQSLGLHDLAGAEQVAKKIIVGERERGHAPAARRLSAALNGRPLAKAQPLGSPNGSVVDAGFLSSALYQRPGEIAMADVMLRPNALEVLQGVITEARNQELLGSRGIRRRSKLIFVGPPGCGKSMAAQAIAAELRLPLYLVRFDAVIGAYLGQTATHLREIFQFASLTPSVLLFDEVDALGKQRGNSLDVGELDRIVIAMMQELEFFVAPGLLIATSNLPGSLDRALWRRFDAVVNFPSPASREINRYAKKLAGRFGLSLDKGLLSKASKQRSYADVERLIESEARRIVLAESAHG